MSVLKAYFESSVNQYSPSRGDVQRKVNYDEDGNEFIVYEDVDYPALVASRGCVSDWSLDALLKAGVNPNFPIHTGYNTRLDGIDVIGDFDAAAQEVLAAIDAESKPKDE